MRWINRLDYKYSKFYIPHLTKTLLFGMVAVFVANLLVAQFNPFFAEMLTLNRPPILRGEVWRLITFIFIPGSFGLGLGSLFYFGFFYFIASSLEGTWSQFKFSFYFLLGVLCAIACMLITGSGSNYYIFLSFVLAFASIGPNQPISLYFVSIKMKWLGIFYALGLLFRLYSAFASSFQQGINQLLAAAFGLVPYFLFFGPSLFNAVASGSKEFLRVQRNRRQWRQKNR